MRPDRPGNFWYADIYGQYQTVRFYDDMCTPVCVGGYFEFEYYDPSEFEQLDDFEKWLGQAHPPKKVDRYTVGILPMDLQIKPHERGPLVLYEDVKEFLLKGDENG